jgi:hypothetical protein
MTSFKTGDIGRITPSGSLVITGRKKDLIIRGGEDISAKEIEDVLHLHPAIKEAAVVSMPHARLGEGICAYLIPEGAEQPDLPTLSAFVSEAGLAEQKCPERIESVNSFPRTASGKIRKDVLRTMIKEKMAAEKAGYGGPPLAPRRAPDLIGGHGNEKSPLALRWGEAFENQPLVSARLQLPEACIAAIAAPTAAWISCGRGLRRRVRARR